MSKFGGLMYLTLSGGRKMVIRGDFEDRATGISVSTLTNQDRSLDQIVALKPYGFSATFKDQGLDFDALLLESNLDVTLLEEHTGRSVLYTAGHFEGEPTINRADGAVSGLTFACAHRRAVTS